MDGEAGYQATLLPAGWHFPLWRWAVRVEKVPLVRVRPGESGCRNAACPLEAIQMYDVIDPSLSLLSSLVEVVGSLMVRTTVRTTGASVGLGAG